MVLVLLSLLCNHGTFDTKITLEKIVTFISRFKVQSVLDMINKEVLSQFIYKPA